ncbi:MAG: hypothetical protein ACK5B6_02905 [Bacteroidia bacterium]|jgi:hypothetical protein
MMHADPNKNSLMKTMAFIAVTVMVITSSCASNKNTTSYESDDRYYSLADARREQKKLKKLNAAATEPSQVLDEDRSAQQNDESDNSRVNDYAPAPQSDGETTIINNYYEDDYDMDDYYDYMYASRIRRFNRPNAGFGYYDPFFTNAYWYTYDPFLFGNSIYSSYSFFNPYVPWGWNTWSSPGFSFGWNSWTGWNVGWGWNSWGYNPYSYYNPWRWNSWGYNPYSPFAYNPFFYSPYSYGAGYMNGFNNGFAYGMMMNSMYNNPVYYNSYDQNTYNFGNSVYYGANTGAVGGGSGFSGMSTLSSSLGDKIGTNYQVADGGKVTGTLAGGKPTTTTGTALKPDAAAKPTQTDSRPSKNDLQATTKPAVGQVNQPDVRPSVPTAQTKPGNAISGKDQLIQQGVMRPTKADAYSSTPVTQAARPTSDNRPESPLSRPQTPITREPNIQSPVRNNDSRPNAPTYNYNGAIRNENQAGRTNGYNPAPVRSDVPSRFNDNARPSDQTRPTAPSRNDSYTRPSESVRPSYPSRQENNYSRPEQRPSNVTQPSRNTERPSYRDYQSPRREERNYQQRSEPQRENRRQNYQPRDSYQPRNNSSAPRQNYQAPSRSGNSRGESRPQYNGGGRSSGGSYNSGGSSPRMSSGSSGGGSRSSGGSASPRTNGSRR